MDDLRFTKAAEAANGRQASTGYRSSSVQPPKITLSLWIFSEQNRPFLSPGLKVYIQREEDCVLPAMLVDRG